MDFASFLRAQGLKATAARIAVLEVLNRHEHPDIEQIYLEVKQKLSCISQATVYKNIAAMLKSGAIIELPTPGERKRYDIYAHEHVHLVCENCHNIYDLSANAAGLDGFSAQLAKEVLAHGALGDVQVLARLKSCKRCANA